MLAQQQIDTDVRRHQHHYQRTTIVNGYNHHLFKWRIVNYVLLLNLNNGALICTYTTLGFKCLNDNIIYTKKYSLFNKGI